MAGSSSNTPGNTMCEFYSRNICMYGDACRFSHRLSNLPDKGICQYYLKGGCRFGDSCWNRHFRDTSNSPSTYQSTNNFSPARTYPEARTSPSKQHKRTFLRNHQQQVSNPQWVHAPEFIPSAKKELTKKPRLCAAFINGQCLAKNQCVYIHGEVCTLCHKPCLNPLDQNQRKEHQAACEEQKQRQDLIASEQRSMNKTCGICLDVVVEKTNSMERKFGILENCNHIFCFSCIMKWRKVNNRKQDTDSSVEPYFNKTCPECRTVSDFVTPSKFWFETEADKKKMFADRRAYLMTKHCRAFKRGEGYCPHGGLCYNLHMLKTGQKVMLPPPFNTFEPAEVEFMNTLLLLDYYNTREDSSSDSDLEYELDELDIVYSLDFEVGYDVDF